MGSDNICTGRALRVVIGITALMVLLMESGSGAAKQINSCTTISSPGEYVLTMNTMKSRALSCINITSSDVIFDGSGFTIDGIYPSGFYGVYVHNPTTALTNVTVRNLNVTGWQYGIYHNNTGYGMVHGNNASNNVLGIWLKDSSNNMLSNNNASDNGNGITVVSSSNNNLRGNIVSSNKAGVVLDSSSNNNLSGNNVSDNNWGIVLDSSSNNNLNGNYAIRNVFRGISLTSSSNNNISYNNVLNNGLDSIEFVYINGIIQGFSTNGIFLSSSNYNMLSGNIASNNNLGIVLDSSSNYNTLSGNIANWNRNEGISVTSSSNNTIYNNLFNNTKNFRIENSVNKWNITKTKAINIEGPYLGGNFWANPNGTGASQTCKDGDDDGICDSSHRLDENNIDYLPLAYWPAIMDGEVTLTATPPIPAETIKAPTTEKASGFEVVLAITTLSVVAYIFWRKKV